MTVLLPPGGFRDREGLADLVAVLSAGGGGARFVGGIVRDTLLGIEAADVDLATPLAPQDVLARLEAAGIRSVPTGLKHGTITALPPSGPVEVTTLRRDVETDGRHALVAFSRDWQEDAARRDFTINALYADPATGQVFDWHDGLADLRAGRVRFIGDPLRRIAEDHLRILRFFRFHARFGPADQGAVDADGLAACAARANDLMALSRERIAAELLKLLVAVNAVPVMQLMVTHGILRAVVPEITGDGVARLEALSHREAAAGVAPHPIRRLAALLPPAAADPVGARLKLSNADRKRLAAATLGPGDEGPRALSYRQGPDIAVDRLLLAGAEVSAVTGWTPPALPITGGVLVARGLAKGPAVARTLRRLEGAWIAAGFPPALPDATVDQAVRDAII